MKNSIGIVIGCIFLLFTGCSENAKYADTLSGQLTLKDRTVVSYECRIIFDTDKAVAEYKNKKSKINYGLRVILMQRNRSQCSQGTFLRLAKKMLKSQMNHKQQKIIVERFEMT